MRRLSLFPEAYVGKAPEAILAEGMREPTSGSQDQYEPDSGWPYSFPSDVWAVGELLLEMAAGTRAFTRPLPVGHAVPHSARSCELQNLHRLYNIFALLGTPNESTWHGWTCTDTGGRTSRGEVFSGPTFRRKDLSTAAPNLPADALSLLSQLLALDPLRRISAREALAHPFFGNHPDGPDESLSRPLAEIALLAP